jgi:hypothetical protein
MPGGPLINPNLAAAANCAGAFLMLVAFVLLAAVAVALHFLWRGLVISRRSLPEAMALVLGYVEKVQRGTAVTTAAAVEPQVRLASTWAGVKAGTRSLVGRPARPPEKPTTGPT